MIFKFFKLLWVLLNFIDNSFGIWSMQHKKVKTEPCLSPESPFMRKPSKEFLQKLAFNKVKPKEQDKNMQKSSEYLVKENITKMSFIPCGTAASIESLRNNSTKLKKPTIDLEKFKIKHENMLLKQQHQEIKRKNTELIEENRALRKQNEDLRKQLEGGSRISKFSAETLENTETDEIKKRNTFLSFGSQESLLQIQSYQILPNPMEISHMNSLIFDDELKCPQECNFLSSSIGKKAKLNDSNKQNRNLKQTTSYRQEIEILNNRISYLEKELQNSLLGEKQLENINKRLMLSVSMSQRKLQLKQSELKEIKIKEKKKKYFQNLYELSSEQQFQAN